MTNNPQPVTLDNVRDLLGSGRMEATLVRWLTADQWHDAGEVEVVSGVMLRDMQYARSGYDSDDPDDGPDYELIITANDLRASGDTDWDNPSPDDLAAAAEWLNSPALYLVSALVGQRALRPDVLGVDDAIRDDAGRVVGARALARFD